LQFHILLEQNYKIQFW